MTFLVLMMGLFLIVFLKKRNETLFKSRKMDLLFLSSYIAVLTLHIVNNSFFYMVSNQLILAGAVVVVLPLLSKIFKKEQRIA